jgi:aspartate/methionine/tyrosine aminotransferase
MRPAPFALERYFARYEFSAPYLLSSSDCDGLPMREVLAMADDECRGLWGDLRLGYTESLGLPQLRAEIAGMYEGARPEDVVTGAPEELIFVAMNALLRPGDRVVCTYPGYQSLFEIARAIGCVVDLWQPREQGDWRFDPDDLAGMLRPGTRMVVVNFPHNPTGALPAAAEHRAALDAAAEAGAHVFSDEMYRLLELEPADRLPSACELQDTALSLSGMSKVFGMAGVRIGWLVTRDAEALQAIAAFKDYTTICSGAPGEVLALVGLRARAALVERHRSRIVRNLGALEAFVARHDDRFALVPPRAGSVCLVRLREGHATDFCRRLVDKAGIMLLPSSVFQFGDDHVRVGLGRENLPDVLARFERALEAL